MIEAARQEILTRLVRLSELAPEMRCGQLIANLRGQLLRRPAGTVGVMFAKKDFTQPAIYLAHFSMPQAILLWSGDELNKALAEEKVCEYLRLKHRICVENAIPDYDIREGGIP